jgi:signal transduction histidine kinase
VVDTGIGISRERLSLIFGAFQQIHTGNSRFFGGTGLGLSISNSLAVLLGFQLSVDSEPGAGSTFSIHFAPAREPSRQSA